MGFQSSVFFENEWHKTEVLDPSIRNGLEEVVQSESKTSDSLSPLMITASFIERLVVDDKQLYWLNAFPQYKPLPHPVFCKWFTGDVAFSKKIDNPEKRWFWQPSFLKKRIVLSFHAGVLTTCHKNIEAIK